MRQPTLFDAEHRVGPEPPADQAARDFAVDPRHDVVLEASAGTGKTRVLVERYLRLLDAGVDPRNILAITFTRKAAAEMRDRTLAELARRAAAGRFAPARWRELSERVGDIQILTIDAFCFSLLREFPLEAGVDPAFEIADETEMARFANEALDLAFRALRGVLVEDESVRLLLARVPLPVLREALALLIDRRHVALAAVGRVVARQGPPRTAAAITAAFCDRIRALVDGSPRAEALRRDGPREAPEYRWLLADLADLAAGVEPAVVAPRLRPRLTQYFLTQNGTPRQQLPRAFKAGLFASPAARTRHQEAVRSLAPDVAAALEAFDRDLDGLLARGLLRVLTVTIRQYEDLLDEYAVLDFAAMLDRTIALLEQQEEFARSRLKLQSRYQHVLVDEFQDTSRRQWRLIDLLIEAWGEGEGVADAPTSIFVVGDRKQSIYRFRHAEVTLLDEAARRISALRPARPVRQAIRTSFRAVPELLAFVNAFARSIESRSELAERFTYSETDQFPVPPVAPGARRDGEPVVGLVAERTLGDCARAVASEIQALIGRFQVRVQDGPPRPARPGDIAILFRARAGHQVFEEALEARGVRTYVYKGLGFFDAPEVQDVQALIRYLARPDNDLAAAELLRSRLVRLSDAALVALAPDFARALRQPDAPVPPECSPADVALLTTARASVARWLALADWMPPGELLDLVLRESAYAFELGGRRLAQAVENIKKVRALVSRVERRGYTTLGRLAAYFETLRAGEESNAVIDATDAVSLMTIHAAKGLEFPIVFVVNLQAPGRGRPAGFSVIEDGPGGEPEVAFGSSAAADLEQQRDEEELRRLFYVAVTRARDRLYLAGEVDEKTNALKRGPRSLASLVRADLSALFGAALLAPGGSDVEWQSELGAFAFKVCHPSDAPVEPASPPVSGREELPPHIAPLAVSGRMVVPAVPAADEAAVAAVPVPRRRAKPEVPLASDERLLGTIVHRLFQRRADPGAAEPALLDLANHACPRDHGLPAAERAAVAAAAVRLYRGFAGRSDVAELLGAGECHYEVPFFFDPPDRPGERIRGVIDCLVVHTDGRVTVVEFKTGQPRPEHARQASWYARAAEAALGSGPVEARILYP